jgi:SAM-dependent methyltransferase
VAFEELKQRQSVVWGNGPFQPVAETIADVHDALVEALAPGIGERWLDVACGTGAVAERAARAGAAVVGVDLAPALVEIATRRAEEQGLAIDYRVGDCERLEGIGDASFDAVASTFGVMFAPDQRAAAAQLARVTRPGGRLGLTNWTPAGGVGRMFAMLAPFQPAPPPEAGAPLDWGEPDHVRALLGDAFELRFETRTSIYEAESADAYWRLMVENFGPLKTLTETLDDERRRELHRTWIDFFETSYRANGTIAHPREYLLVLGPPVQSGHDRGARPPSCPKAAGPAWFRGVAGCRLWLRCDRRSDP